MGKAAVTKEERAKRIAAARAAKNLSQQQLASEIGVSIAAVRSWERKEKPATPGADDALAMAAALGTTLEALGFGPERDDHPELNFETRYTIDAISETSQAVEEYLASPRGQTTPVTVQKLLRNPGQTAFHGLGLSRPAWEDIDDVRRILERRELRSRVVHGIEPLPPIEQINELFAEFGTPSGARKVKPRKPPSR